MEEKASYLCAPMPLSFDALYPRGKGVPANAFVPTWEKHALERLCAGRPFPAIAQQR